MCITESLHLTLQNAMEAELDSSAVGKSFEKVGELIPEGQMDALRMLGPLDQTNRAAIQWLEQASTSVLPGATLDSNSRAQKTQRPDYIYVSMVFVMISQRPVNIRSRHELAFVDDHTGSLYTTRWYMW